MCNPEISVCNRDLGEKEELQVLYLPSDKITDEGASAPRARHSETLLRYEIILAHPRTMVLTGNLRKFRSPESVGPFNHGEQQQDHAGSIGTFSWFYQ